MGKTLRTLIIVCIIALAAGVQSTAAASTDFDPYYLLGRINNLRSSLGLHPYQMQSNLVAAAQGHSQWGANTGTFGHTGAGGSTPKDRALAAGYGGGQNVRVWENIYWGSMATTDRAFEWWMGSDIHYRGMTHADYYDIGIGIAQGGGGAYFTLKFGVVAGGTAPPSGNPPESNPPSGGGSYIVEPIEVAQPNEDGSVIHVVGEGQNISDIADAYDVPASEILALNRISEDAIIRPGDELIIVPAPVDAQRIEYGPITHTVEQGQTLFGISRSYDVPLEDVLLLNGLTESTPIFPGDELLIREAIPTPTPSPTPPLTSTPRPTLDPTMAAQTLSPAERRQATAVAMAEGDQPAGQPPSRTSSRQMMAPLIVGGLALVGMAGAGLIVVGGFVMNDEE